MALQFAFHLGSLAFATTLLRNAMAGNQFVSGLEESAICGMVFLGIGFVLGEISRHMMEELAARELAAASELPEGLGDLSKSTPGSTVKQDSKN